MQTLSLSALLLCTFSVPQISEGMVQGLQEDGAELWNSWEGWVGSGCGAASGPLGRRDSVRQVCLQGAPHKMVAESARNRRWQMSSPGNVWEQNTNGTSKEEDPVVHVRGVLIYLPHWPLRKPRLLLTSPLRPKRPLLKCK